MALDGAEFISELSIVDPPGTDPLNQGDDHIRTTKKAVQQSFPNVGSAVPQTGVQMAQMAIKNEVNVFTQVNEFQTTTEFQSNIRFEIPGQDRGLIWNNTAVRQWDLFNTGGGGANDFRLRRYIGGVVQDEPFRVFNVDGSILFPNVVTFGSSTDFQGKPTVTNGSLALRQGTVGGVVDLQFQEIASGFLQWIVRRSSDATGNNYQILRRDATGGSVDTPFQIDFGTGEFLLANPIRQINGTAALPAYAFTSHANAGMYRSGTNRIGFTTAGIQRMDIGTTRIQLLQGVEMPGLPTTNPGGSGVLWKSSGFVAIT